MRRVLGKNFFCIFFLDAADNAQKTFTSIKKFCVYLCAELSKSLNGNEDADDVGGDVDVDVDDDVDVGFVK